MGEQELAVRNIVQILGDFLGPLEGGAMQPQRAASLQVLSRSPDAASHVLGLDEGKVESNWDGAAGI